MSLVTTWNAPLSTSASGRPTSPVPMTKTSACMPTSLTLVHDLRERPQVCGPRHSLAPRPNISSTTDRFSQGDPPWTTRGCAACELRWLALDTGGRISLGTCAPWRRATTSSSSTRSRRRSSRAVRQFPGASSRAELRRHPGGPLHPGGRRLDPGDDALRPCGSRHRSGQGCPGREAIDDLVRVGCGSRGSRPRAAEGRHGGPHVPLQPAREAREGADPVRARSASLSTFRVHG